MAEIIAKIDRSTYKTQLSNGRHELLGDEPIPLGTDSGPTPYDYLLMSLGSCVAMTLRMYADRKGWDLETVEVHLNQSRIYAKDCEDCESEEGYVHIIEKKLSFTGNLGESQRKRLMEIADKCPVNKTLLHEIKIVSEELL
ncbi:MAG: OsmC family protein [Bacteroidota bacterium]